MSATGPTGPTGPTEPVDATGPDLSMFPSAATGPVDPPHIATLEELMASYGAIVNKEAADRAILAPLLNESRETLRVPLFQWASAGFPDIWVLQTFTLEVPQTCSDGISRNIYEYFEYCLGTNMGEVIATIQTKLTGIQISYSFQSSTLRLHVSKA